MCKGMSCKYYHIGGDRTMKGKKKWYDYLWIVSLTYLILGFFNILFAWLGLLCFFIPLIIAIVKGNKAYCNKYCGRGQLFSLVGGRFGLSRKKDIPKWMKSHYFRYGFLIFFFAMFFLMLWNTYLVFAGSISPWYIYVLSILIHHSHLLLPSKRFLFSSKSTTLKIWWSHDW